MTRDEQSLAILARNRQLETEEREREGYNPEMSLAENRLLRAIVGPAAIRGLMMVSVDHSEPINVREFIRINTEPDVSPLSYEEILMVNGLKVGESTVAGMSEVRRVS